MSIPAPDDSFVFVNVDPANLSSTVTKMEVEPHPPEMKSMHVVSNVRNRYARTVVTSKYANPDQHAQEATFSIVLPDTAFIAGFIMEIKGKKFEAYVKEKEEAKQEYQQAVSSGRAAAHVAVSARDSNKFTVSVNVEPQSDVTFILTYEELLMRKHSKYEMVVNLHPGQFLDDFGVDIHINETRPIINIETPAIRSGNEISDKVKKNNYATITNDTEGIVHVSFHPTVEQQKEIANGLSNTSNNNGMSGQFVVEYDVQRNPLGGEVLVNDGYFVHFFAPTELKPIPKHVVFVLDVSGSMQGRKIEQLKEAMKMILSELNPDDYFNIIKFGNVVQVLYNNNSLQGVVSTSLPVTAENINKAQKVVGGIQAGGGTNISDALITALSITSKRISVEENTKIQPIIVFLTDGQANVGESNPDRIIDLVLKRNDTENETAIFTLAFGNDANKEFLKELAMKNSGFLRNIYEAADASMQLQDFYKQISSPLLTNVNFKYSEEVKEVTKHKFDILFNGSEFVVTGKVGKKVDDFVVVEGSTLYGIADFRPTIIPIKEEKEKFGDLERLWAYMTIKQLLDKKYEKTNNKEDIITSETSEKQALKLALKYSFVTPVTSLVVVKPEDDLQWGTVHVASPQCLLPAQEYERPKAMRMCFGMSMPQSNMAVQPIQRQAQYQIQYRRLPIPVTPSLFGSPQLFGAPAPKFNSNFLSGFAANSSVGAAFGSNSNSKLSHIGGGAAPSFGCNQISQPFGMSASQQSATGFSSNNQSNLATWPPGAPTFESSSNSQPSDLLRGITSFGCNPNSQPIARQQSATEFSSNNQSNLATCSSVAPTSASMLNSQPSDSTAGLSGTTPLESNQISQSFTFGTGQPASNALKSSSNSEPIDFTTVQSNASTFGYKPNECGNSALTASNVSNNSFDADIALQNSITHSPELKSMYVVSNVRNRYARTVVTRKYANLQICPLQTTFSIVLPDTAFMASFVMEINGTKYEANVRKKDESKNEYQKAVDQGLSAAYVTDNADDPNKYTVSVNIEPQSEAIFILAYEQRLILKDSKYEIVINLHPEHTLEDFEVQVKINDTKPILNVETPKFRSKNLMMKSELSTINKNKDGCIDISFKPTVEEQKEIINIVNLLKESEEQNGISGQFILEYNIESDSEDIVISENDVSVAAPVTDLIVVKLN